MGRRTRVAARDAVRACRDRARGERRARAAQRVPRCAHGREQVRARPGRLRHDSRPTTGRYLEIYGTAGQIGELKREDGIRARLVGKSRKPRASASALPPVGSDAAFDVWRRYDRVAGDSKEQYLELYDRLEGQSIVKKVPVGTTHLGRQIVALKVTKNAKAQSDNTRPAVLYSAVQHAREWLAGETCRRTLLYFTQNYGKDTEAGHIVTPLVDSRELWFMCIANPDGYEYTFTPGNRLWRKNMADNDHDGNWGEIERRRRPEPQLRHQLGPRQRGLVGRPDVRDLPRHRPGLRAGDQGDEEAVGHGRLPLPEERPHRRGAAAVPAGLPAVHLHAGQRDLRGAGR